MDNKELVHMVYRGVYPAATSTVKIFRRGIEQSPYAEKWITEDTIYSIYASRLSAVGTDQDDPLDKYWKLRRNIMLYDIPERPIDIRGPDAARLLEKAFTRKISDLKVWRARYGIICAPNGGLVMDGVLIRLAEDHFWYVEANGDTAKWFLALSDGMNVSISDPKSRVLQIQGPNSLKFLDAAAPGQMPENFGYFHAGMFDFDGQSLLVSRTGWTGELGIEIYGHAQLDHSALWDYLFKVGEAFQLERAGSASLGLRRIEAGILDYQSDIDLTMTPYDAGLGDYVDLSKGEFVGRQALEYVNKSCRLYGYVSETAIPNSGLEIFQGSNKVGITKSSCWSPTLEKGIGYVVFDHPDSVGEDWFGKTLSLYDSNQEHHDCVIVELPFFDNEKKIPRGLSDGLSFRD
ncbi:aminomethyltransferase family protein [Gammaproteobacteria bacterium]|jgi:aminomethyltransferase|nr:aminomethyltransferase family protein [Gammaproteobacteria bacterium]MDG2236310.1 aminomethyltransferase family protein [Arenicellales bacterium]